MQKRMLIDLLNGTNNRLELLKARLTDIGALEFNSSLPKDDIESCYNSLLVDRVVSKFETPKQTNVQRLKTECFNQWFEYDSTHKSPDFFESPVRMRKLISDTKIMMSQILKRFNYHYARAVLQLPKRETLVPMQGRTSYYEKLSNPALWTVTPDCVDDAVQVILSHSGLRACAKKHLARLTPREYSLLYRKYGKLVFEYRIKNELLVIVQGSRASSVYKNTKKRRFINIEPMFNVIIQKLVGQAFRQCLKDWGCDLDLGQQLHRKMIQSDQVCTIDLSNASDSTFLDIALTLLPKGPAKRVLSSRSSFTLLPTDEGRIYIWPKKVSSMGNGFTFELLTLMLYSACQIFDRNSSVYGDDIIINKLYAKDLIELLRFMGYNTNEKKTFINHPVRESCGAFFIKGYGYITSYDFKYCITINDVINTVNKLGRIVKNLKVDNDITREFTSAYIDILRICPSKIRGPSSPYPQLPTWVEFDYTGRRNPKAKDPFCKGLYRHVLDNYVGVLQSWQVDLRKIEVGVLFEPKTTVYIKPTDKPDFWLAQYYLYNGMRMGVSLKVQVQQYRPVKCVFIEGTPVSLRELRRVQKGLRSSNLD